jgi:hypothetical protein
MHAAPLLFLNALRPSTPKMVCGTGLIRLPWHRSASANMHAALLFLQLNSVFCKPTPHCLSACPLPYIFAGSTLQP